MRWNTWSSYPICGIICRLLLSWRYLLHLSGVHFGRNIRAVYTWYVDTSTSTKRDAHTRGRTRGLCPLLSPCRAVLIRDERVERAIACGRKRATVTASSHLRHRYIYIYVCLRCTRHLIIVPAVSVHNVVVIAIHKLTVVCTTPHIYKSYYLAEKGLLYNNSCIFCVGSYAAGTDRQVPSKCSANSVAHVRPQSRSKCRCKTAVMYIYKL